MLRFIGRLSLLGVLVLSQGFLTGGSLDPDG